MPRCSLLLLFLVGCAPKPVPVAIVPEAQKAAGLHNLYRVSPNLWSGSRPEGDTGFASLQSLGIKTVISVDGSVPEISTAEKYGLRYVHLPVGYDGIPRERALEIAKAVRDLPGPVYVHCHHGKHRGPAAAAAIRLCLDPDFTPEQAEAWMNQAGTDPRYTGLFELPKNLKRPTKDELDAVPSDFPAVARVANLTRSMVEIDGTWDKLKAAKNVNWPEPVKSAGDAVLLIEHYREAKRLPQPHSAEFAKFLAAAEAEAGTLEWALRRPDGKSADTAFVASQSLCQRCHGEFRDRAK